MNVSEMICVVREKNSLPSPAMRSAIRKGAGATQALVAETVGVSRATVAHYERGTKNPRGEHLTRYLEVLSALAQESS